MLTAIFTKRKGLSPAPLIGALLGALAVLLFGFFAPIPRLLSGEEDLTGAQMPAIRSLLEGARSPFLQAQGRYMDYVHTRDVSADLMSFQQAVDNAQQVASNEAVSADDRRRALSRLHDAAVPAKTYMDLLQPYAEAGEPYFSQLRGYDDSLMGWSRSLGSRLEELKVETRPIADYLRLYPPPVGDLSADPPWMTAAQVSANRSQLAADLAAAENALSGQSPISRDTLGSLATAFANDLGTTRDSGRSIERIESLHAGYYNVLTTYDRDVQEVVSSPPPESNPLGGPLLANSLNVIVGLVILGGLTALFAPRRSLREF